MKKIAPWEKEEYAITQLERQSQQLKNYICKETDLILHLI